MQGLESLNQFKSFVSSLGGLGRYEDTYVVHAAEGETVVPMEVLDQNPMLKKRLFKTMTEMGIEPGRYIVGNELNSINPITGQPEFFLKRIKKALADISGYAAPIVGAMYGPAAGAMVGAGLGAFKRENPGDPNQALQMALLGGGSGIASNLAGGQKMFSGIGLSNTGMSFTDMLKSPFTKGGREQLADYWNFKGFDGGKTDERTTAEIIQEVKDKNPNAESWELEIKAKEEIDKVNKAKNAVLGGMDLKDAAVLFGLGTTGLGLLIDKTTPKGKEAKPFEPTITNKQLFANTPYTEYFNGMADGGVMDLQQGGESVGPGTGTSDSIPAMLSDGEFVMTAKAVRGAGGGDRREGARRMYEVMDRLEGAA